MTRTVIAVAGDVTDPEHRARLVAAVGRTGSLDLLVNNASTLGPAAPGRTPLSALTDLSPTSLTQVLSVNVIAPFALTAALLPALSRAGGIVIDISSDAAVEHYPDWGGYGASKAALDHLTLTFGVENVDIACYAVDPGDMRTDMQQAAFPGEDISDRRSPDEVVPAFLELITTRPPNGRYRADDLLASSDLRAACGGDRVMTAALQTPTTTFSSPDDRTATEPPEYRGLARDQVRLLVASPAGITHARLPGPSAVSTRRETCWWSTTPARCPPNSMATGGPDDRWWCTWPRTSGMAAGWLNCAPRRTLGLPS